jgi:two-component system chemotaxis response regulator CheB
MKADAVSGEAREAMEARGLERVGPQLFPQANFDAVVIAGSLGGLDVLRRIVELLPADFPAPVIVVQHISPVFPSHLPQLLARASRLTVKHAEHGERLRAATVFVAPPDRHVRIEAGGRLSSRDDARVNFVRPAADPLFSSAASALGTRSLGVVLTGMLSDGAVGGAALRAAGGVLIAQDPSTCQARGMPEAAIALGGADFVLAPTLIAYALIGLVMTPGLPALFGVGERRKAA